MVVDSLGMGLATVELEDNTFVAVGAVVPAVAVGAASFHGIMAVGGVDLLVG